jgi:hypothetical protein
MAVIDDIRLAAENPELSERERDLLLQASQEIVHVNWLLLAARPLIGANRSPQARSLLARIDDVLA